MLNRNGKNNADGSFDWADAVIDAAITAGITLCSEGMAMVATGLIYTVEGQLTLIFSAIGTFLGFLGVKRGLRKKQ